MIEIKTQAALDKALKADPNAEVTLIKGSFSVTVTGIAAPLLILSAGVDLDLVARESSQPRVVAWESSQPRVVAWGSSQPRVEAWESSQPRVEARGSSMLSIQGRVCGTASENVSVHIEGGAKIEGGRQITVARSTAQEWCDYYGVRVTDGVALLYKGVEADYRSPRGGDYTPGTIPVAADWDGGNRECGGGLHFSPAPMMTHEFINDPAHYLACPVALSDISVHPDGDYPQKVKARGCCAPVYEVDEDGEPVEVAAPAGVATS